MFLHEVIAQHRQRTGANPTSVRVGRRLFAQFMERDTNPPSVFQHPDQPWVLRLSWPWEIDLVLVWTLGLDDAVAE